MKLRILLSIGLLAAWFTDTNAQCNLQITPEDTIFIPCGQTQAVLLSAFGNTGNNVLGNNFNDTTLGIGWQATLAATLTNPCGPGPDSVYMWMGNAAPNPRILTTQAFDLSLGALLCFDMRFAVQGQSSPCEGPDEPTEGVYLQFSTDNGATWNTIQYFDPNGGYDPILTTWNQYCFTLPPAAETPNTQIRWAQDLVTSTNYDHWGLDNVYITIQDTTYDYSWTHTSYSGNQPPPAYVNSDTVFTVYYNNPVTGDTCTETVVAQLIPPTLQIGSIIDSTVCSNTNCVDLDGIGNVFFSADTQATYEINVANTFAINTSAFTTVTSDLIVSGINHLYLPNSTIESVCIPGLSFFGNGASINNLEIVLVCPSLDTITLVPSGVVTTGSSGYNNTCFVPGGADLSQANPPYSGNYAPAEDFSNLNGCGANGTWQLIITNSDTSLYGSGILDGWDITFHDPELLGGVISSWSPNVNLTNPDSLNATVCPDQQTTYTLTISDSLNCTTLTHDVTIDVVNIDSLQIEATIIDQTCDEDNGEIFVTIGGTPGNESLAWSNNAGNTDSITGLPSGDYTLTVSYSCVKDTTFTVASYPLFSLAADVTNTTCELPNGMVELLISGGYGDFVYDWSDGQNEIIADSLVEGTYDVTVNDSICSRDTSFTLTNVGDGIYITALDTTNPFVNQADGIIIVETMGGTPPFSFSIDGGENYQPSNVFELLDEGLFEVIVKDANGCIDTVSIELEKVGEIIISNVFNPSSSVQNNAYFKIFGMRNPEVTIFNRWGKKIYENSHYQNDWDGGNYRDGVYYYISKDNFDGEIYKGATHLIRGN